MIGMNKNFLYHSLLLSSLLACAACSEDEVVAPIPDDQKTPIELSVGGMRGNITSRSTITVAPTSPLTTETFNVGTNLFMVMKSEKDGSDAKYTRTQAKTQEAKDAANPVSFAGTGCTRYWDDAYARDAKLSVYSVCTPESSNTISIGGSDSYSYTSSPTTGAWSTTAIALTTPWEVQANQSVKADYDAADLCFSNNISKYTKGETVDNRMHFDSSNKHFTAGEMYYYHALSKITFIVQKGEGFAGTSTDFKFAEGQNITINNVNLSNTVFNIEDGEFTGETTTGNITKMYNSATTSEAYTLDALVLPGVDFSSTTVGDISFTINGNQYNLAKKDLLDKISDTDKTNKMVEGKKLKAGVNYRFTLTIGKTKIDNITAKLVNWETVEASFEPTNARINVSVYNNGEEVKSGIDLYRLRDSGNSTITDGYVGFNYLTAYGSKSETLSYADNKFTTGWFWDDNTCFYHFRTVSTGSTVETAAGEDYITLSSAEGSFTDTKWGAPFKSGLSKFQYNTTNGFDKAASTVADVAQHDIYQGIGPTKDNINITMFHMLSNVVFKVKSATGDAAVVLENAGEKTKIELRNVHKAGKALMGNGLISTTDAVGNWVFTQTPTEPATGTYQWEAGIVPQSLADVQLVITTPDNNEYIVDLKDVIATTIGETNFVNPYLSDKKITAWYPCYKYVYTFTLEKKKIDNITATILGWEDVISDDTPVQIK